MQKVHSLRTHRSRDRHALCSVGKCSENFQHLPGTPLGIPSNRGVKNKKETFLQATHPQLPSLGIWLFWLRLGELKKLSSNDINAFLLNSVTSIPCCIKGDSIQYWRQKLFRFDKRRSAVRITYLIHCFSLIDYLTLFGFTDRARLSGLLYFHLFFHLCYKFSLSFYYLLARNLLVFILISFKI